MVAEALIFGPVVTLLVVLVADVLMRGGEAWWCRKTAACWRGTRSRYRAWQRARHKKRVEAGLDKVAELVSREKDCKASHPGSWPEELKRLWHEAAVQLIERQVDWRVVFEEHGATIWASDDVMHVHWGNSTLHVRADLRSFGASGDTHDLAGWDHS